MIHRPLPVLLSNGGQVSPLSLVLQVRSEALEDSREKEFTQGLGEDLAAQCFQAEDESFFFPPSGVQMLQLRIQEHQAPR